LTLLSTEITINNAHNRATSSIQRKQQKQLTTHLLPTFGGTGILEQQQQPGESIQISNLPYHHLQATKNYVSSKANKISKRSRAVVMQEEDQNTL